MNSDLLSCFVIWPDIFSLFDELWMRAPLAQFEKQRKKQRGHLLALRSDQTLHEEDEFVDMMLCFQGAAINDARQPAVFAMGAQAEFRQNKCRERNSHEEEDGQATDVVNAHVHECVDELVGAQRQV